MLQDAAKRIEYTAKQAKTASDAWDLYDIAVALTRAIGRPDLRHALDIWPGEGEDAPPAAWIADILRPLGHTPFDPLIPWLFTQLRAVRKGTPDRATRALIRRVDDESPELLAWFIARKPNLGQFSLAQALAAAQQYANNEAAKVVYAFPDGWTVRRLETKRELEVEGDSMDHCVGQYCDVVASGSSIIYSLRDPEHHPHVTMEYMPSSTPGVESGFAQIFGPRNQPITDAVRPYVVEFLVRVHGGQLRDLLRAGVPARDVLRPGAVLHRARLEGADLRNLDLTGIDLTGANLNQADFHHTNLTKATLVQAQLTKASLDDAILVGANLTRARLQGADLLKANLTGATLIQAYLPRAGLAYATLTKADLTGATLSKADLADAILPGAILIEAELDFAVLRRANLQRANLTGAILTGADLTDADLTGATMPDGSIHP